jgi:FkbM family methyltransferase
MAAVRERAIYHGRLQLSKLIIRPSRGASVQWLGTTYGGRYLSSDKLGDDAIVYSCGVGDDVSFDLAVIESFGCVVHAFDPTPAGQPFGEEMSVAHERFLFHPWGFWDRDGTIEFFEPADPNIDESYSAVNLGATDRSVPCEVRRVGATMRQLGHDHIDLLKIDIEGAEFAVLNDVLWECLDVRQICVEFDQPVPLGKVRAMTDKLRSRSFQLLARRGWDYTFARPSEPDTQPPLTPGRERQTA